MSKHELIGLNKTRGEIIEGKEKILRNTFGAISGRPPEKIKIDTVRYQVYDNKGEIGTKVIPGSGDFRIYEENIRLHWGNDGNSSSIELKPKVIKKVNGEPEVNEAAEPTYLQIVKAIGQRGAYPDVVGLEVKRAWVSGEGVLQKPSIKGDIPFKMVEDYIITRIKRDFLEHNGSKRVNLIKVGSELTDRKDSF